MTSALRFGGGIAPPQYFSLEQCVMKHLTHVTLLILYYYRGDKYETTLGGKSAGYTAAAMQ